MQLNIDDLVISPSPEALTEAEHLSAQILENIELNQLSLSLIVLKALRLARLLNDFEYQQIFEWESGGYPGGLPVAPQHVWEAAVKANRNYIGNGSTPEDHKWYMYTESIEQIEAVSEIGLISLQAARDPDVSLSSANQSQYVTAPIGNRFERDSLRTQIATSKERIASRRTFIYSYASRKYNELRFGRVADDVFGRIRSSVDALIGQVVPGSVMKFTAIYDNLRSGNPEDWANAVHGCRRVLQELADCLFPPTNEPRKKIVNGKEREVKLGNGNYINRLIAYIEDSSESDRFNEIVGTSLDYIGSRLDALYGETNKGSHAMVTREEADRCVIYTYMIVGDILSLGLVPQQVVQLEGRLEAGSRPVEEPERLSGPMI